MIAVIGVASIVGIRLVKNNIKADKLEQIQDKILEAVAIYIENNEEAKQELYSNNSGIVVPLKVLENEGLIDFQDIKIDEKKDYVLTMLGSGDKSGACIDTTTIGSWQDGNKTIYLCANSDGTSSISTVGFSGNNLSLTSKNKVWFNTNYLGENYGTDASNEAKANNYVIYKDRVFKIYYIDRDDSLALISFDSFGSLFDGKTQKVSTTERTSCDSASGKAAYGFGVYVQNHSSSWVAYRDHFLIGDNTSKTISNNGEVPIGTNEIYNANILYDYDITKISDSSWFRDSAADANFLCKTTVLGNRSSSQYGYNFNDDKIFKIQLKPCMKINGGNGDKVNPYILKDYCK